MSGWIKFEKELQTDPRVLRIAKEVSRRFRFFGADCDDLDPCNALSLPAVTLVCGALARLWCYADSHIRDDDTLDLSPEELDDLLGVPGFCALMPSDWLSDMGDGRVELPGFTGKNGVEAKKRALTAKRVNEHRKRKSVTESNAAALPDQTRPDQTRPDQKDNTPMSAAPTARPGSTGNATDLEALAADLGTDPDDVRRVFAHWQTEWGHPRAALDAKRRRLIRDRLKSGYSADDLCRAISGYRNSPHHCGQNDRATVYDDIGLFLRSAGHVDAGLRFAEKPPRTDQSKLTRGNVAAVEGWKPPEMRRAAN